MGRDYDVCMIRGVCVCAGRARGDVIGWGHHKIYVAFTVEQVVKCNYRGGRHTAEPQPSRQTGRKTRRQVIKAYSSTLSLRLPLRLSLFMCVSQQLQTHKSAATSSSSSVKTAEPQDMKRSMEQYSVGGD